MEKECVCVCVRHADVSDSCLCLQMPFHMGARTRPSLGPLGICPVLSEAFHSFAGCDPPCLDDRAVPRVMNRRVGGEERVKRETEKERESWMGGISEAQLPLSHYHRQSG